MMHLIRAYLAEDLKRAKSPFTDFSVEGALEVLEETVRYLAESADYSIFENRCSLYGSGIAMAAGMASEALDRGDDHEWERYTNTSQELTALVSILDRLEAMP